MSELFQQCAHPPRMRPNFDHHMGLGSREKPSYRFRRGADWHRTLDSSVRPENRKCALSFSQIASDCSRDNFLHGRFLLAPVSALKPTIYFAGRTKPPPHPISWCRYSPRRILPCLTSSRKTRRSSSAQGSREGGRARAAAFDPRSPGGSTGPSDSAPAQRASASGGRSTIAPRQDALGAKTPCKRTRWWRRGGTSVARRRNSSVGCSTNTWGRPGAG